MFVFLTFPHRLSDEVERRNRLVESVCFLTVPAPRFVVSGSEVVRIWLAKNPREAALDPGRLAARPWRMPSWNPLDVVDHHELDLHISTLQLLLAERFRLAAHNEGHPNTGYALVVDKNPVPLPTRRQSGCTLRLAKSLKVCGNPYAQAPRYDGKAGIRDAYRDRYSFLSGASDPSGVSDGSGTEMGGRFH